MSIRVIGPAAGNNGHGREVSPVGKRPWWFDCFKQHKKFGIYFVRYILHYCSPKFPDSWDLL